ncbi:hypothetical protein [Chitinimonas sp.]|uniref:hypothetical protein n=1 Tax=Chitinimonas sp. TaxID=1934313 RepID=UPI0035B42A9B
MLLSARLCRFILPAGLALLLGACQPASHAPATVTTPMPTAAAPSRVDDFRQLRDALYHQRRAEVKTRFGLPLAMMDGNQLAAFCHGDAKGAAPATFDAAQFDRCYGRLFPPPFIQLLLKVKSDVLFNKGYFDQAPLLVGEGKASLIATLEGDHLTLMYNTQSESKLSETETSMMHHWQFEQGQLRYLGLQLAD